MPTITQNKDRLGVFGAAIVGDRSEQQDAFRLQWIERDGAWLLVAADGMGGHTGGGLASRIAADSFVEKFQQLQESHSLKETFYGALQQANQQIAAAQKEKPDFADMGTTLVAAHLSSDGLTWISVGDSPLFMFRQGKLYRLNEDHSLRALPGSAPNLRNMLQSVLNGEPIAMIDFSTKPVPLARHDVLVLASDGVLTLTDEQIVGVLAANTAGGPDPERLATALLVAVEKQRKPKQDNCTVIAVAAPGASNAGKSRSFSARNAVVTLIGALVGFLTVFAAIYFIFRN
jgi:protein phosphatase